MTTVMALSKDLPSRAKPRLMVLSRGSNVEPWLTVAARQVLDLRRPADRGEPQPNRRSDLGANGTVGHPQGARRVVCLPVDGPPGVLRFALAEIGGHGLVPPDLEAVIPESLDGSPPNPIHLVEVLTAGLPAGVDLDRCRWTTQHGMWVPSESGPVFVEIDWSQPNGGRGVARLLAALLPLPSGSPVADWLDSVAAQREVAAADWIEPLQGAYLEAAARHIDRARRAEEARPV